MTCPTHAETPVARVNGEPLHAAGELPDAATLRQRACSELLRQAAQRCGLLGVEDRASADGVLSLDASEAIERLLDRELHLPEPDDEACRRHHAAHAGSYRRGERVRVRHILFAVTAGVDVAALRQKAEQVLLEVRCDDGADRGTSGDLFAHRAAGLSNCPSGARGGELGWLQVADCVPEFGREVFGHAEVGVLPRLVHSRFGLHVVEVCAREGGEQLPYEEVRGAVRLSLQQRAWALALRQYLQVLAADARLEGVALDAAPDPLVQ